ncbi:protein canopy homolog 4 [Malaya genurostris]|uniref:protein canopy homolog 4 n=1 Tax=Malaya genurostris TaxID=325434 RepID=UPI0026F39563|nr:protein canopy homolog 4 [Malaya genurostris]XP_058463641.1 protein canopy homolog 4 [Malaya genurostris]XP_058463642.1 protein canopy homolog 4 [Malaya genurostris]XP_058463643.1 protein canopy homolog 4 [Malaya genurostris]
MYMQKIVLIILMVRFISCGPEEDEGVKYASKCEACKILATELEARLSETGRSHDVIELGYSVDDVKPKKRTEYRKSELRLLESMENVCDRILEYNIHKERQDSTRFAKGMSQTFQTLHGLVDKGVKVDLGIPYELWDKPSAEITQMKSQCETMVENFENVIEKWYFNKQDEIPLIKYLCEDQVLKGKNHDCLYEILDGSPFIQKFILLHIS